MVVDLNQKEQVQAYVKEHAGQGLAHVIALVRADRDAMLSMISDLTETEATYRPSPDEYSTSQVMEHLNSSLMRSLDRLRALSSGAPWSNTGAVPQAGGKAADIESSWAEVRSDFIEGEAEVLAILEAADEARGLDQTADHAQYGPFNWLEWAIYSHHVHTSDHVAQVASLRQEIRRSEVQN